MKAAAAALVVAAIGVGVAVTLAERRWASSTDALTRTLQASERPPGVAVHEPSELEGLPPPVARYFRAVLRDGQRIATKVRVAWEGEFNTGRPGADRWRPFTARQEFVPGAPGFVWSARIRMAPGVPVLVRDGFVLGEGSMRAAVLGIVDVADVAGPPAMAEAALQRYLGEAVWFPTALLPSQGVSWSPLDESRARASLAVGRRSVSLEFRFGADGLVAEVFAPDRSFDDGEHAPVPRPWRARLLRYAERDGSRVPVEAVAEWELPDGVFEYWRGRIVAIVSE